MKKEPYSILIIDDDPDVLVSAEMFLEEHFSKVHGEPDPKHILEILNSWDWDIVLLDMNFKKGSTDGKEGLYWLERILEVNPNMVVILMTAFGEVQLAVDALKKGAFDFILKPWKNAKLLGSILAGIKHRETKKEVKFLTDTKEQLEETINQGFSEIIGDSHAILKVKELIEKIADTDANVLILGENGTGKELVARELHKQSKRQNQNFVHIDLGAVAETLFESELFGHTKGAFTDAKKDKAGRFELAKKGTIFLDEIGNLSSPLQAKILSVLENRKVTRLGSNKEINIDVRLVSATNMDLNNMVTQKLFRQDLLYRINTFEIILPPLRDREDDIILLANHFISIFSKKYNKKAFELDNKAIRLLKQHNWPGNIRELKNSIERAVVLSQDKKLNLDSLIGTRKMEKKTSQELNLEEVEKQTIMIALQKNKGNITKTAKDLGIQRNALYRRLEKYDL
jgi:two-component system, NtrC family, response regulator HydG